MESTTTQTVKINAKKLASLLGLKGVILNFHTPSKQKSKSLEDKVVVLRLRIVGDKIAIKRKSR